MKKKTFGLSAANRFQLWDLSQRAPRWAKRLLPRHNRSPPLCAPRQVTCCTCGWGAFWCTYLISWLFGVVWAPFLTQFKGHVSFKTFMCFLFVRKGVWLVNKHLGIPLVTNPEAHTMLLRKPSPTCKILSFWATPLFRWEKGGGTKRTISVFGKIQPHLHSSHPHQEDSLRSTAAPHQSDAEHLLIRVDCADTPRHQLTFA